MKCDKKLFYLILTRMEQSEDDDNQDLGIGSYSRAQIIVDEILIQYERAFGN